MKFTENSRVKIPCILHLVRLGYDEKMKSFGENLEQLFKESGSLEKEIRKQLAGLKYE